MGAAPGTHVHVLAVRTGQGHARSFLAGLDNNSCACLLAGLASWLLSSAFKLIQQGVLEWMGGGCALLCLLLSWLWSGS